MRFRSLAAASLPIALAVACAHAGETGERSTGNQETAVTPSVRSTGATETRVVAPPAPIPVTLAAGEAAKTIEGRTRADAPAVVLFTAPTGKMLIVRLSSPDNKASLVVYQPGDDQPSGGTRPQDGAISWTGALDRAGELRLEVITKAAELPFRITLEVAADHALTAEPAR